MQERPVPHEADCSNSYSILTDGEAAAEKTEKTSVTSSAILFERVQANCKFVARFLKRMEQHFRGIESSHGPTVVEHSSLNPSLGAAFPAGSASV
ncbi:hypothetical protein AND_000487 [Anopheles darlingi]|uniref:Uncharacterized protein n=2 Tax=Anopheles darlingi TaxID=43151 RepID=W5JW48_ANODA|nr:hypothetical protein AND_000487 [Anopheles darlingi]